MNQGINSVVIGLYAGFTGKGENSVAIRNKARLAQQSSSSIVINAGNLALSGVSQRSCYIQPIWNVITGGLNSNIMCYDRVNKEVINVDNVSFANPVSFPLGTGTQTSVTKKKSSRMRRCFFLIIMVLLASLDASNNRRCWVYER